VENRNTSRWCTNLAFWTDILIHSSDESSHVQHLQKVFDRLRSAGLTLCGKKCHLGTLYVQNYLLGSGFSADGM